MKPIPTLSELQETLSNDFKSRLNILPTGLKKTLNAFSIVLAANFKLAYLYLSDIQSNIFPDTAQLEENGGTLERLGRIYLNRNPKPATVGVFVLTVTGVNGSVLRSGLTFKSNEGSKNPGKVFILDFEYTLVGTTGQIVVRSLGGGNEFDLNVTDELTITEPVIGVDSIAKVLSITTQPVSSESTEVYRQFILDAIQLEPQGGSKTDYRLWASDAQGVRKVYPYVKLNNAGTVQVFVEATEIDSTDGFGTPSLALINEVKAVIEFDPDDTKPLNERGRRPIQANIEVNSIVLIPVDLQITGLVDSSVAVKNSIQSNLKSYLFNIRPYIAGADLPRSKNDILYEARLQSVVTDVLDAANFFTGFNMQVNGVSVDSYQFELGNIPYLRNLTY